MSEREKRWLAPFYAPEARTGAGKNGASWRGARYNSEQQVGTALETLPRRIGDRGLPEALFLTAAGAILLTRYK